MTTTPKYRPATEPDPREGKLPVWAKGTIDALRRKVAEEQQRNAVLQRSLVDQAPGTEYGIEVSAWQIGTVPVPSSARVRFYRPGSTDWLESVEVYVDDQTGDLTLLANSGYLLVKPKASNVVALDGGYPRR